MSKMVVAYPTTDGKGALVTITPKGNWFRIRRSDEMQMMRTVGSCRTPDQVMLQYEPPPEMRAFVSRALNHAFNEARATR